MLCYTDTIALLILIEVSIFLTLDLLETNNRQKNLRIGSPGLPIWKGHGDRGGTTVYANLGLLEQLSWELHAKM